jgi:hypothetical protein
MHASSSGVTRAGLFLIAVCLCMLPAAGFTVTAGPSLVPDEQAVLGETVKVDTEMIYDVSSMNEFITAYTDLASVSWDATIIVDGREMPLGSRSGRYLTVTGFELYNPGASVTKLQVHLEGIVPEYLAGSREAEVLSLEHIAGDGSTILDSVSAKIPIIDLAAVNTMRTETVSGLMRFEEGINTAYHTGTDTSAAEGAAADVRDRIEASRRMNISDAHTALSEADSILHTSFTSLNSSVTRDHFQNAEEMVAAIDPAIAEYRDADGADEQGILVVLSYQDNADTLLVLAHDRNSAGDDTGARQYAEDAYEKATDAMEYLAGMYTKAGLAMRDYTPGATGHPQPSSENAVTPSPQLLSLPDFTYSGAEGNEGIDLEGTLTFIQVIIDGFRGMADFIQHVTVAFSDIGNQ